MNTLLIESNRIIAEAQNIGEDTPLSLTSSAHKTVTSNASWATTIDTGIELNIGDTITMEACALNITGAGSGDFQQYRGKVDVAGKNGGIQKRQRSST